LEGQGLEGQGLELLKVVDAIKMSVSPQVHQNPKVIDMDMWTEEWQEV
jgi:hypothetical protein